MRHRKSTLVHVFHFIKGIMPSKLKKHEVPAEKAMQSADIDDHPTPLNIYAKILSRLRPPLCDFCRFCVLVSLFHLFIYYKLVISNVSWTLPKLQKNHIEYLSIFITDFCSSCLSESV